ncbi:uncharacterized protein TRAVEDRAFT_38276 [Trametes versicolor FP-101664 SS1]|uniref:uncharacterized protein n=1 Tax=Trametes versicolor (strain FP-101664) TaxID=717944 RepID=UPI0004622FB9|nr:uncharacterized protein TRAVEDRAFT_38276 [Trametes versicolor FP-101664 SS1]EIW57964.1 hypothetical protein TRAVEDRAFT_38276 [Trametes versicolor FP-101664 SS1]
MVRFKNRWLLVELLPVPAPLPGRAPAGQPEHELTSKQIWAVLKQSIITHFGDTGWGAVGSSLTIKYFSPRTNLCIIRVAREPHKIAWAGVALMTAVDGRRYVPHVVHVSGTIKQAQLAAIRHNREIVARYRARAKLPAGYQDSYEEYLQTSAQEIEALQD